MHNRKKLGLGKNDLHSQTARNLYDKIYKPQSRPATKEPVTEENPAEKTPEQAFNLENTVVHSARNAEPEQQAKPEINVSPEAKQICATKKTDRPSGKSPTLRDFDQHYFERMFGIVGDKQAKYRTILNMINSTSMIFLGPASAGKSVIQEASKELLPEGMPVTLADPKDIDDALQPETTHGKAWYAPEIQILIRGSRNQKDVLKLLSNKEAYKGMKIAFFATSAAYENDYFQKFIVSNKELMRRLDLIDVECSFGKVENIREAIARRRMEAALGKQNDAFSEGYFRNWMTYFRNLELEAVADPYSAYHDQYFVKSFKSFDPIKRYHKLEDALLKMHLEENSYDLGGRTVCILSLREKYRADAFRKNINNTLERLDDFRTIKKHYRWSDADIEAYQNSIENAKKEVDWQECWESGLESLEKASQKGLLPRSVTGEYVRRHVINGKITAIDDYTGEEIVLAEHPKPRRVEATIVTPIAQVSGKEPERIIVDYAPAPRALPRLENSPGPALPAPEQPKQGPRQILCLPAHQNGDQK